MAKQDIYLAGLDSAECEQRRMDEVIDTSLRAVNALCERADALCRRWDAFEESQKAFAAPPDEPEPLAAVS
jgi:hypothetical protein